MGLSDHRQWPALQLALPIQQLGLTTRRLNQCLAGQIPSVFRLRLQAAQSESKTFTRFARLDL